MRKKNTSDRKKLKTKYTDLKKKKTRRIKIRRDKKQNPNKYHRKKADPGIPNAAPFKNDIINEKLRFLEKQQQDLNRSKSIISEARAKWREEKLAIKRKLTDVVNLKKTQQREEIQKRLKGDESDEDEPCFPESEMRLYEPADQEQHEDMEQDEDDGNLDDDARLIRQEQKTAAMLANKARLRAEEFNHRIAMAKNEQEKIQDARMHPWTSRTKYNEVKKVVEDADILLEVLDARDPLGTRCSTLESLIRSRPHKKLVFVLNKADLVPKSNLEAWLKYLRAEAPTVPFRAAIQQKSLQSAFKRMVHLGQETLRTGKSMGCDMLLQLLKNYARTFSEAGAVVGVVGLPNVGKSSIINSLKKLKTCEVAPTAGSTRSIRLVKLDAKMHLIDSPGVAIPSREFSAVEAVLKNVVNLSNVRDLIAPALEIFNRSNPLALSLFYGVKKVDDGEMFLSLMSKKAGKFTRDGVTHIEAAAQKLLHDWNHGVLRHYTEPPKRKESEVQTRVILNTTETDPAVNIANEEAAFMQFLSEGKPSVSVKLQPSAPVDALWGWDEDQKSDDEIPSNESELSDYEDDAEGSEKEEKDDNDAEQDGDTSDDFRDAAEFQDDQELMENSHCSLFPASQQFPLFSVPSFTSPFSLTCSPQTQARPSLPSIQVTRSHAAGASPH
ncbi:GTP binding domain [Trinorchestia longiramus]|nr:GTP binding domain [Trinorchestia longiramus]